MRFEFFISLRYLLAKRRQAFISLITFISMIGVAVGVMALVVVLAVMNGFQRDLRERILGVTSHIVIGSYRGLLSGYPMLIAKVQRDPGVVAATPLVYSEVMLSSGSNVTGAILRGINPESAAKVVRLGENMIKGKLSNLAPNSRACKIILGNELASRLGADMGSWITVIAPTGNLTPLGHLPKSQVFEVVGIFQSGIYDYDNNLAYVNLKDAQRLLGIGDVVSAIEVKITDIYAAGTVAKRLKRRLGFPFWVRDWIQMNRNLFSALKLEKTVMFIILALIVLVAAFNIVGSLIMLVMEKTRDIAILKAMGATTRSIGKIFILEGLIIGVFGTVFGIVGGISLCELLKRYHFVELPKDVYYISTLPVQMELGDMVIIAASTIGICLLATIYPALQAARLSPAEALRYE